MDGAPTDAVADLAEVWVPVGLPGFSGDTKHRRQAVLDARFGDDGWRIGHLVRGRIVPPAEAIGEYEEAYRRFLRDRPALVRFLVTACGNVYDDRVENVHEPDAYNQPATIQNRYRDISVRRVISESWTTLTGPTSSRRPSRPSRWSDLGSGESHPAPRARGFRGRHLLQIRDPLLARLRAQSGRRPDPRPGPDHDPPRSNRVGTTGEGCGHLSVEAFWQMSKVIEVRYDRFLALGDERALPLADL